MGEPCRDPWRCSATSATTGAAHRFARNDYAGVEMLYATSLSVRKWRSAYTRRSVGVVQQGGGMKILRFQDETVCSIDHREMVLLEV